MKQSPLLRAMREDTPPGRCMCCDEPLIQRPGMKRRVMCGHPECTALYNAVWKLDRRTQRQAVAA